MVIGGSTASGKSALGLTLARKLGGVIVNADSQQLFADLPILTARPSTTDEEMAPHRLYGVLAADEQPSVGRWLALLEPMLAALQTERRSAIIVGGTGLYLHALLHGIPVMPVIPATLRAELRAWAAAGPAAAVYARLQHLDPSMATRLQPGDQQRVLRALEVIEATGRSLLAWQADPRQRLKLPATPIGIALVPPPASVNPRLEARLDAMLDEGAMAEVADLLARRPDAMQLPIAKVHGLRELTAVHRGALPVDRARTGIAAQIRQYAKRQRTWFRHQLPELQPVATTGETEEALAAVTALLDTR
ncbi:MAG: tRNA (adenosine(37)-N6)-dimethylallyltransferase MiaA [Geminicoccaceae bacterium]